MHAMKWLAMAVVAAGLSAPAFAADKPAATDDYPLDTCVVSGEKLGSMGDAFVLQYEGKTVKFCCKSCVKTFKKDPAKYLAMIDEARKKKADAAAGKPAEPKTEGKKAEKGACCGG